jgi:hypothetical protein
LGSTNFAIARASGLPDGMTAPVTKGFAIHERIKRTSSLLLNAERNGMLEIKIAPGGSLSQAEMRFERRHDVGHRNLAAHERLKNRIGGGIAADAFDPIVRVGTAQHLAAPLRFFGTDAGCGGFCGRDVVHLDFSPVKISIAQSELQRLEGQFVAARYSEIQTMRKVPVSEFARPIATELLRRRDCPAEC